MEMSISRIIACSLMTFCFAGFCTDAQQLPDNSSGAYIGCFEDVGIAAVFINPLRDLTNLTAEFCRDRCRNEGHTYIGLWGGSNCWCAQALNSSSSADSRVVRVDDGMCSASCSGDQSQSCGAVEGGGNIYSVYSVCPRTKWGRGKCKQSCNCKNNSHCSVQGVCPENQCADGWKPSTGSRVSCSVDVNECESKCDSTHISDCHNCSSELKERCSNTDGSFECVCDVGYRKFNSRGTCSDVDECSSLGLHRCNQTCHNTIGSYSCSCSKEFTIDADGHQCNDIDECGNKTHSNCSQECNNSYGGFSCSCRRGYELEGFSICKDVDECTRGLHSCNQTCHNTNGSYSCNCTRGFTIDSDGYQCNDIDECDKRTHNCSQNCSNSYGGFSCFCRSGYQLEGFSNCTEIDECKVNNGNCAHSCKNTLGSYSCSCNEGYRLTNDSHLCEDINECQADIDNCQQQCINTIGSYECKCNDGYELNIDRHNCSDIDECLRNLSNCNQNCANTAGSYICSCFDGYELNDSFTCFDIDECKVENGGCEHYCSNTPGGFYCSCEPGYRSTGEVNGTSKYNCTDIDECAEKSSKCGHTCNNTIGSYVCGCNPGFELLTNRFSCQDIDECELKTHSCAQRCYNRPGNYSCTCNNGYYLIGSYHCEKDMTVTVLAVTICLLFILLLAMVLVGLRMKNIFPFDKPRFGRLWRQRGQENPHENGTNELKDLKELKTNNSEKQNLLPVTTTAAVAKKEKTRKTSVAIKDLKRYIANIESNEGFEDEFRSIQMVSDFSYQEAQAQALKPKNRFKNILPYDHNRVVLNEINDDPLTTYINASFIKGYSSKDKIIASHGPTPNTLNDFWRMIWQFDVSVIVMVTKCMEDGKVKCEQYWPLEGSMESGELTIVLDSTEAWPDYVISRLKVTKENTSRLIVHLLFTDWPDHGVPDHATSLISFRRAARNVIVEDKYFLVHCSAGVGRTGTFLAIDYLLQQAEAEGSVDVYKFLQGLRDQRMHAVQTTDQYEFIHDALLETLTLGETTVQCPALPDYMKHLDKINPITGKSYFTTQFDMLQEMHPLLSKESTSIALDPKNLSKNRDEAIVPGDSNRVFLSDDSGGDDYINAVFVSSYRRKDAFISAELPLPETVKNFWLLTLNYRCRIVVFLDLSNNADDLNSCLLIPEKTKLSINRHKFWTSSPDPKTISSNCDSYLVSVSTPLDDDEDIYANAEEIAAFKILVLHFRLSAALLPTLLPEIHDQIKKSSESIKDKGSVVIVSRDGVNPTGQLIAVTNLLEMSNSQHEVDIFNAVHNIKKSQPHFISTIAEYRTIYDAIVQVESDFSTYANY